jgi:hypothetical protein
MREKERGQSMLELALILPLLLILLVATVEAGFALRNYLLTMSANREGIRFAARGRFTDGAIAQRIVSSAGMVGTDRFLRTTGPDPNTTIILTHIPIRADGTVPGIPDPYISGTLDLPAKSEVDTEAILERHIEASNTINDMRVEAGYERLDNEVVVLEVFYKHRSLWLYDFVGPLAPGGDHPGEWVMYTQSTMRVVSDARAPE